MAEVVMFARASYYQRLLSRLPDGTLPARRVVARQQPFFYASRHGVMPRRAASVATPTAFDSVMRAFIVLLY